MADTLPQTAPQSAYQDATAEDRKLVMDVQNISKRYRMTSPVSRTDKDGNTAQKHHAVSCALCYRTCCTVRQQLATSMRV